MEEECTVETRHFELSGVTQKEVRDSGGSGWQEVMFQTNKQTRRLCGPLVWAPCASTAIFTFRREIEHQLFSLQARD